MKQTFKSIPASVGSDSGHFDKELLYCVTIRITNRCDFLYCVFIPFFLVFSLQVSGLHGPIIRGISSCCFYATIWFMQCFVDRLRASADWFVVVTSVYQCPSGFFSGLITATICYRSSFQGTSTQDVPTIKQQKRPCVQ